MKIVFTTDLHGEVWKYERLLKAARDFRAAVVINGGDMLPKAGNLLEDQGKFITGISINISSNLQSSESVTSAIWAMTTSGYSTIFLRVPVRHTDAS